MIYMLKAELQDLILSYAKEEKVTPELAAEIAKDEFNSMLRQLLDEIYDEREELKHAGSQI